MKPQEQINQYQNEIGKLQHQMNNCNHEWSEVKYDPETQKEEYLTGEYENQGVHHWPKTALRNIKVDRWSRECKKCGKIQYTYKQKPVNISYAPEFN